MCDHAGFFVAHGAPRQSRSREKREMDARPACYTEGPIQEYELRQAEAYKDAAFARSQTIERGHQWVSVRSY